jgi:deoxyribonuclease-4
MSVRVRQILKNLTYRSVLRRDLIPDLVSLFEQTPQVLISKRHPPFVYKCKDFSGFGVVMETIIQNGFRLHLKQPILPKISVKNLYDSATQAHLEAEPGFNLESFQKYVPTMINIVKELCAVWKSYPQLSDESNTIIYDTEYNYKTVSGHPDVVTDLAVLDVKTTANFKSMAEETALQILAYYALIKPNNPNLKYVGVILPMQRTVAIYDISNWDYQPYLDFLAEEAHKMAQIDPLSQIISGILSGFGEPSGSQEISNELRVARQREVYMRYPDILYSVGSHYARGKNLSISLMEILERAPNQPIQMFLSNPRSGKLAKTLIKQIPEASQLIASFNLQFFTHAPYVINLCANEQDADTKEYWQQNYLNENLIHTVSLGGKGVVVHTGSLKYGSVQDAINTMELMVRNALPYATEDCPLLLETSAGEGADVCVKIEELGAFFYRFTEEERRYLGVCVDTCHVFSSGYCPYEYLKIWEERYKIRIGLIHFNESAVRSGACCDRHENIGNGFIGTHIMIAIADWANQRKIPMVRE